MLNRLSLPLTFSAGTSSGSASGLTFSNSNGVSFGNNLGTVTASYTVPSTAGLLSNVNLSAGTTSNNLSAAVFSNSNNVSFGMNGSTITGTASFNQTNQSAIKGLGVSNTGQTAGNTGVSTGIDWVLAGSQSITLSQSTVGGGPDTIWIQHPAWLTTAMQSNAATISNVNVSAGTTSNNLSAVVFSNSNNVSFGLNGSTVTGTASFNQTNQSAIKAFGASNTGNTAGNTGVSTGIDWVIAGTNNITVSESTAAGGPNTLWLSGAAGGAGGSFSAGVSTHGATSGSTGTVSGQVVFVGTNGIGLSESSNGASATISIQPVPYVSNWFPIYPITTAIGQIVANQMMVWPIVVSQPITATLMKQWISLSISTTNNSSHAGTLSMYFGIYTRNGSTLSLATSGSTNYQWTNTANNSLSVLTGHRFVNMTASMNLTPGEYWFGLGSRTSTGGNAWWTGSNMKVGFTGGNWNNGELMSAANSTQWQMAPGFGVHVSTTVGPAPVSLGFSDIQNNAVQAVGAPLVEFCNITF